MGEREAKSDLRRVVRQSRTARSPEQLSSVATNFTNHLTAIVAEASLARIAAFLPTPTEPPITAFLTEFLAKGGWCAVPESGNDGVLLWHALEPGFDRDAGVDSLGMPLPSAQNPVAPDNLDAVLVPAAHPAIEQVHDIKVFWLADLKDLLGKISTKSTTFRAH